MAGVLTDPGVSCAALLRQVTAAEHDRAESSSFVAALLEGSLGLTGYLALAGQHVFVYAALEWAADRWRDDPIAGPFVIDGLDRLPALHADLARMLGPDWHDRVAPLPATRDYCAQIAGADSPARFVAHHYTRYLGDVSGGQVIAAAMRRQHGDSVAVAFYDFSDLYAGPHSNPAAFRRHYRSLLDQAPWDETELAALFDEATVAFRHNRAVFGELADQFGLAAAQTS